MRAYLWAPSPRLLEFCSLVEVAENQFRQGVAQRRMMRKKVQRWRSVPPPSLAKTPINRSTGAAGARRTSPMTCPFTADAGSCIEGRAAAIWRRKMNASRGCRLPSRPPGPPRGRPPSTCAGRRISARCKDIAPSSGMNKPTDPVHARVAEKPPWSAPSRRCSLARRARHRKNMPVGIAGAARLAERKSRRGGALEANWLPGRDPVSSSSRQRLLTCNHQQGRAGTASRRL